MSQARFRTVAWATLALTLGVILWGAYVRATGSGAGCGSHWPTCNGEIIPRTKTGIDTIIEFTHRATSGLAFLVTLLQLVWAVRAFPKRHAIRFGAALSMFFMVTEALVGAGLVIFEHVAHDKSIARAYWMAVHLINTFLLVASMTATVYWASGGSLPKKGPRGAGFVLLCGSLVGAVIVGVTGAIAALGDTLFPAKSLAEGLAADVSASAHTLVQLRIFHPVVAVVVAALSLFSAAFVGLQSPALRKMTRVTMGLVCLQIGAGFVNVALLAPVWMQIVHLLLADFVWISLVVLMIALLGHAPALASAAPSRSEARVG